MMITSEMLDDGAVVRCRNLGIERLSSSECFSIFRAGRATIFPRAAGRQ
jgi:hypothetical protein